jgi:hypothetical protein
MSAYIPAVIILVLISLAGYFFLSHSIDKKNFVRQQLIVALRAKRNKLRDLTTDFPHGFLPKQLSLLLYSILIDTCEQLTRLEPSDLQHTEQLELFTSLFASHKHAIAYAPVKLLDPQKIREARHLLQELYRHIELQSSLQLIDAKDASFYSGQISQFINQLSADTYMIHANEAQQMNKPSLAHHYFVLARKALLSKNSNHHFDHQITELNAQIEALEEILNKLNEEQATASSDAASSEISSSASLSKEWETFSKPNEDWKKKQNYD